jgi:hypothetical protein
MNSKVILATAVACMLASMSSARAADLIYEWYTVANNGDLIPETTKTFNSYNQPAVNTGGMVVFRARSRGGQGQPEHGIYVRDLGDYGPIVTVFRRGGSVPQPNNATYGPDRQAAAFNEFPSVPRIDSGSDTIATRGQSQPVWEYTLDGAETRTGTAGVYTNPAGMPTTGASMLGNVAGFAHFKVPVPGLPGVTRFDQFPGSPAITGRNTVVFKGNFTVNGVGKTGVFYRNVAASRGLAPIELIASSYTMIPGTTIPFGSTAPPSAAGKYVVFAGYDNEADPHAGGIYRARLGPQPIALETVVAIGDAVPGEDGETFTSFGEAVSLSSNGRHVLFWGSWGEEMHEIAMHCPEEGNAAVIAYCETETARDPYRYVPVHQGFFLRDMRLGRTVPVARTGDDLKDFVYWNFSGRAPGVGGGEEGGDESAHLARWRTATFGAVSGSGVPTLSAIKARSFDGSDGIYLREILPSQVGELFTLLKTGLPGAMVDPEAPDGALITSLGLERDGFRGDWLALTLSMATDGEAEEDTGWAGTYAARFIDEEELVAP